jgi:hypothetical protein
MFSDFGVHVARCNSLVNSAVSFLDWRDCELKVSLLLGILQIVHYA